MGKDDVEARMQALLDGLQYGFEGFAVKEFAERVAREQGRPIAFIPRRLPPKIFGVWIKGDGVDVAALKQVAPSVIVFGEDLQGDGVDVVFYETGTRTAQKTREKSKE